MQNNILIVNLNQFTYLACANSNTVLKNNNNQFLAKKKKLN